MRILTEPENSLIKQNRDGVCCRNGEHLIYELYGGCGGDDCGVMRIT